MLKHFLHWRRTLFTAFLIFTFAGLGWIAAQEGALSDDPDCQPEALVRQQTTFADLLPLDFEADPNMALANLYRLGALYQELALRCGYQLTEQERATLAQQALTVLDIADLLAAQAIGTDLDTILAELEGLRGDPLRGQLLYNGGETALDGSVLGCAGCHSGQAAPLTEGTWTRATEIRLQDPALSGQTFETYMIESIVNPNAYIAPGYLPDLMPNNFGRRIDAQQLADLIAYLESQDQLLDE